MRLAIASNMLNSVTVAPHVTAVFEADFSAIMKHREANKAALAARGSNLSYTAYIVAAAAAAMRAVPEINSRWHDDHLEIFDDVNIGVGTALGDKGLVVPVIRRVQDLSLAGIATALQDLTARARAGTLKPEDMRGGTFTISNHGVSGSLLASPDHHQPAADGDPGGRQAGKARGRARGRRGRYDPDPPHGLCFPDDRSPRR